MKRILNVCIPCRERRYLTEKVIESLYKNSSKFSDINIYCFDNLSNLTADRISFFLQLLKEERIHYYSYDTESTLDNCFPKAVIYQRWLEMMETKQYINNHKPKNDEKEMYYYMLIDNDMLFGPRWDEPFISVADKAGTNFTHFLVKYPGGLPGNAHRKLTKGKVKNIFNENETIEIVHDSMAGSSGMWFMTFDMLVRTKWKHSDLLKLYNKFNGHDSHSWSVIRRKQTNKQLEYVIRVKDLDDKNPTVIHLGGAVGSLVNLLKKKKYNDDTRLAQEEADKKLGEMTIQELYEKYKEKGSRW